jgi:aerobic carbon-monoxide dehydrogenase small subunit
MANKRNPSTTQSISLTVNGQVCELDVGTRAGQIDPTHTLVYTLRETLGLTGTKAACNQGACGACTVIMDGKAVNSCKILTIECEGKSITTIEGLRDPKTGELDPLQQAFITHAAFQCGFCTPGMIMTSKALLNENPHPTEAEIKEALSGNFCRCVSHYHVLRAVLSIAERGQ